MQNYHKHTSYSNIIVADSAAQSKDYAKRAEIIKDSIIPEMAKLRKACDKAETLTSEKYWPFPTYGKLLFGVR